MILEGMQLTKFTLNFLIASTLLAGCNPNAEKSISLNAAKLAAPTFTDEIISLTTDNGRTIYTRVLTPAGCEACPLVIFSHGANAAYDRYDSLLLPLAKKGYRIAAPNHTDSEDHPDRSKYIAANWLPTRLEDYNVIAARYETNFRVAAGHSFGAMVAQIAGGAEMSLPMKVDPAYKPNAVLAYSPPGPIPNYIDQQGWSKINVPSLVTTGTKDIVPMMAEEWELHLVSYESSPPGLSFALIYENMDHYMNGAYGRETQNFTETRERALNHLVDTSAFFMAKLQNNNKLSSEDWETQQRVFVEARSKNEY